jgi:hypothetical protein
MKKLIEDLALEKCNAIGCENGPPSCGSLAVRRMTQGNMFCCCVVKLNAGEISVKQKHGQRSNRKKKKRNDESLAMKDEDNRTGRKN